MDFILRHADNKDIVDVFENKQELFVFVQKIKNDFNTDNKDMTIKTLANSVGNCIEILKQFDYILELR